MNCFHKIFACKERKKRLIAEVNRGEDWDYGYIYSLLAVKLENIRDYTLNDSVCDKKEWGIEWLIRAINLCWHLSKSVKYPKHINTKNYFRFLNNSERDFYRDPKNQLDSFYYHDVYDMKARNLLFEILKNKIDLWWDLKLLRILKLLFRFSILKAKNPIMQDKSNFVRSNILTF